MYFILRLDRTMILIMESVESFTSSAEPGSPWPSLNPLQGYMCSCHFSIKCEVYIVKLCAVDFVICNFIM